MLNDTLRNTRAYQKILKEGREQGREEGRQESLQQELQRQKQVLLKVIQERFPEIMPSVRKELDAIENSAVLWDLIVKVSTVQTAEDAEQLFRAAIEDKERA